MAKEPVISIIAPIYQRRHDCLKELHQRISEVMKSLTEPWELILVDDGSPDGSTEMIRELAAEDEQVRPVIFARNFGHQIAVTAGLDYSRGEAVVIIDADLQDPPEVILDLIAKWREGYEVVYAVRAEREGETWFKTVYRFTVLPADLPHHGCENPAGYRRFPLDGPQGGQCDEPDARTAPLSARHVGLGRFQARLVFLTNGQPALPAQPNIRFRKMFKLALNAITGFSYFPLQLATYLGFFAAGVSILAIPIVIILRMAGSQAFFGQATTLIAVLFLGGVQLISLGILGEYLGRVYDEVKGRPLYIVSEAPDETITIYHTGVN